MVEQVSAHCERCGAQFEPKPQKRFCSRACKRKAKDSRCPRVRVEPKVRSAECLRCHAPFETVYAGQGYCSERCRGMAKKRRKYWRKRPPRNEQCLSCGTKLQRPRPGTRFCSLCGPGEWARITGRALKQRIVSEYGGACSCCGETRVAFLCVDHVNNDGAQHRREVNGIYSWLKSHGFPRGGFQLLCFNCNMAKAMRGQCPHQSKVTGREVLKVGEAKRMVRCRRCSRAGHHARACGVQGCLTPQSVRSLRLVRARSVVCADTTVGVMSLAVRADRESPATTAGHSEPKSLRPTVACAPAAGSPSGTSSASTTSTGTAASTGKTSATASTRGSGSAASRQTAFAFCVSTATAGAR